MKIKQLNKRVNPAQRIALLSVILAILVVSKYALGFIPGFEIITYSFIVLGLYLSISEIYMVTFGFWLLVNVSYGFNVVFVPYLWIFSTIAMTSKFLFRVVRIKFVWAAVMSISPILLTASYFFYDWFLFDYAYAATRVLTAIPTFLLASISTAFMLIAVTPYLTKVFNISFKSNINIGFGNKGQRVALIVSSAVLSVGAITGTYRIQSAIYDHINSIEQIPSFGDSRYYTEEQFYEVQDRLGDNDIHILFIFNKDDKDNGDAEYFTIDVKDAVIEGENTYLYDVLKDISDNDPKWKFNFNYGSAIGVSFRNFSYNGKWYGHDNYCGFSSINGNRAGTGVSGTLIKSKYVYSFDYHSFHPSLGSGYCRYSN